MTKYQRLSRLFILWLCLGMIYLTIEGIWRGWTHIAMLLVGGLCGVAIGAINQFPKFYKLQIIWQSLIGTVTVLIVEFISGVTLNIWFGMGIWDYTGQFGNIAGQICVQYGILWFFLMPFAIWIEDYLRWLFWREDEFYSVITIYKELFAYK